MGDTAGPLGWGDVPTPRGLPRETTWRPARLDSDTGDAPGNIPCTAGTAAAFDRMLAEAEATARRDPRFAFSYTQVSRGEAAAHRAVLTKRGYRLESAFGQGFDYRQEEWIKTLGDRTVAAKLVVKLTGDASGCSGAKPASAASGQKGTSPWEDPALEEAGYYVAEVSGLMDGLADALLALRAFQAERVLEQGDPELCRLHNEFGRWHDQAWALREGIKERVPQLRAEVRPENRGLLEREIATLEELEHWFKVDYRDLISGLAWPDCD